jgi:hypothetical protein
MGRAPPGGAQPGAGTPRLEWKWYGHASSKTPFGDKICFVLWMEIVYPIVIKKSMYKMTKYNF